MARLTITTLLQTEPSIPYPHSSSLTAERTGSLLQTEPSATSTVNLALVTRTDKSIDGSCFTIATEVTVRFTAAVLAVLLLTEPRNRQFTRDRTGNYIHSSSCILHLLRKPTSPYTEAGLQKRQLELQQLF